jgi:hypothetical protein
MAAFLLFEMLVECPSSGLGERCAGAFLVRDKPLVKALGDGKIESSHGITLHIKE